MPIYEFRCQACQKVTSFYSKTFDVPTSPHCSNCGSEDMVKLMGSFVWLMGTGPKSWEPRGSDLKEEKEHFMAGYDPYRA